MTFDEYIRRIDWSLAAGRRRTRQAASTMRELVSVAEDARSG
jgi:hypothetical protein